MTKSFTEKYNDFLDNSILLLIVNRDKAQLVSEGSKDIGSLRLVAVNAVQYLYVDSFGCAYMDTS